MAVNFKNLNESEKEFLLCLAILPAGPYPISELIKIFQIESDEQVSFFNHIYDLSLSGYLKKNNSSYYLCPNMRRKLLNWQQPDVGTCSVVINYFATWLANSEEPFDTNCERQYNQIESLLNNLKSKSFQQAYLSSQLSNRYLHLERYGKALYYSELAINMAKAIDSIHYTTADFYRNNALINRKLGRVEKALLSNKKDLQIFEQKGISDQSLLNSYFSISVTYEFLNNFKSAIKYSERILNFEKGLKKNDKIGLSWVYQNLSSCYIEIGENKKGVFYIKKALNLFNPDKKNDQKHYKYLNKKFKFFAFFYTLEGFVHKYQKLLSISMISSLILLFAGVLWWIYF